MLAAAADGKFLVGWAEAGARHLAKLDASDTFGVPAPQPTTGGEPVLLMNEDLLGAGEPGAFALWAEFDVETGLSRLQWAVARSQAEGLQWSEPLDPDGGVNAVPDWEPSAVLLADGTILATWLQGDIDAGDDTDLYWKVIDPLSHGS
jgi:hypothetical protein